MPSDSQTPEIETNATITMKLLLEAAEFFENLGQQDAQLKPQMDENAKVFRQMTVLLQQDPEGMAGDRSHAELASALLRDSADFFRKLGEKNEPIQDKMNQNADIFEQVSVAVAKAPNAPFNQA